MHETAQKPPSKIYPVSRALRDWTMESEDAAKEFLEEKGLLVERFSKAEMRLGKTPDFKVFQGNDLAFYCEVKESERDSWLSEKLNAAKPGELVGGMRPDPVFNRLTTHIHTARKQFDRVNPDRTIPNVLLIYNADANCGFNDLIAVLTGCFPGGNGLIRGVYARFSEGRIKEDTERMDLIIWLDEYKSFRYFFLRQDNPWNSRISRNLRYNYDETNWIST